MASAPPIVDHTFLIPSEEREDAIPVGSPAWFAWIAGATSFAFRSAHGTFTAHKEHRTPNQEYWKAYRRRDGRLHRAYLGKSHELTLDRLNRVASQLAGDISGPSPRPSQENATSQTLTLADDADSLHLLATKFALPPSRNSQVPRPRLAARFEAAIAQRQKLILVAAPAGFGKTTAVGEWLHSASQCSIAWLALDEADNQLNLFLAYLIAALERAHPHVGVEAWALLRGQAARPLTQAILISLINALATLGGEIILVLDDYHVITLPAIHEAITFLFDHIPPHMHLIMTTRADPPLPLARLRARGQLAEVRAADLRFTREEAVYLFEQVHQVALSSSAVILLESRTEGWAAGLQLAALSLHQQDATSISLFLEAFSGTHTYVFDYLAEEVFQKQPEHIRQFLVQTAILDRLCGPLCAAVTGQDDAQAELVQLDQANLFLMPLDMRRRWYRYHPLFRDFLRAHLERAVEAAERARLYRRASAWFELAGLTGEAIDYALQAHDWNDALRCLAPLMADQQFYEYFLDWPRWLAALPDAALQANPDLCLRLARILILIGHIEAAERPFRLAEAVWRVADDQLNLGQLLGYRAVALALKQDLSHAMALAQQALAILPADAAEQRGVASYVLGYSTLWLGQADRAADWLSAVHVSLQNSNDMLLVQAVAAGIARALQLQGQLQRAATLYQDVIRRAGAATHLEQPVVYFFLGRLYYEWNNLSSAEHALREGIAVGQRTGRGRLWPSCYAALAWVRWAGGDVTQTTTMMEQALATARLLNRPSIIAEVEARQAGLWLAQGDLPAAVRWLAKRALGVDDQFIYEQQAEYLLLARIRITQEREAPGNIDLDGVIRLLERLLQMAEADQRMVDRIVMLALLALAHAARRDSKEAQATLATALALAEPEGYIRTFVDEGAAMRSLLATQRAQIRASDVGARLGAYIDTLLDAFSPAMSSLPLSSPPPALLSERERTVLRLLARGHSVQKIASDLIISVHTARAHVKNIYAKLDAHNRVEAIERAHTLNLL
jgi:LuxR family maltose regulon positive regulatory protein